jgi:hypothetical protein
MNALAIAAYLTVSAFTGHHDDAKCAQVRAVRQLALQERLDDRTLASLEERYCSVPQPQQPASGDCSDLHQMLRLAEMSAADPAAIRAIEAQRAVSCSWGSQRNGTTYWPNGNVAKYSSGTWYYPNGNVAKYSSGTWYYSNGNVAKYASGTWYYPNGNVAKYASGAWYSPTGSRQDPQSLIAQACQNNPRRCYGKVERIRELQGDERDLALLELAWLGSR